MINQIRQWSDRKKKVEVPLISSYVFVQLKERDREAVFEVPGIVRYVYWLEKPAIVRDEEIAVMKAWLSTQTVEAKVEGLRRGDRMKVTNGLFEGKEGFVEEISKNRVLLLLPDLGMKITLNRNL
jgi:transcriptional antiterminator RfaH